MRRTLALLALSAVFATAAGIAAGAPVLGAGIQGTQISEDPYTDPGGQHKTQVEPDSFSYLNTVVTAVQTGRAFGGGASNIGWATSKDGGNTWTNGFLPGTTPVSTPPGPYLRVSDPVVAFDPKRNVWLIGILGLRSNANDIVTARSTDGGLTWSNPVNTAIGPSGSFYDKNWLACDTSASSPFFGNCYTQWDDAGSGNLMLMSTSTDGGLTWGPPKSTPNFERGTIGGNPVVMASGKVVVPFLGNSGLEVFHSTDGGNTWTVPSTITNVSYRNPRGGIRAFVPLPAAEVRIPGPMVIVWPDCRFRPGCAANDMVMVSSPDGSNWSSVRRIPLDPIDSTVDRFIVSVAVQQPTAGSTLLPRLAVASYFYPVANCTFDTCRLHVGFSFSTNFGATWSPSQTLAGPIQLSWIANTSSGRMVGDYMSTSYVGNNAFPFYADAFMPNPPPQFLEHLFTTKLPAVFYNGPTRRAHSTGAIHGAKHQWRPVAGVTTAN